MIYDDSIEKINNKEIYIKVDKEIELETFGNFGGAVTVEDCYVTIKNIEILDPVITQLKDGFFTIIVLKLPENIEKLQNFILTYIGSLKNAMELSGKSFWNTILENSSMVINIYNYHDDSFNKKI